MKAVVAAFNQEKALVGAISVITNLRMELYEAIEYNIWSELLPDDDGARPGGDQPLALAAARRGEAGQHWRPLHAAAGRPGPGPVLVEDLPEVVKTAINPEHSVEQVRS